MTSFSKRNLSIAIVDDDEVMAASIQSWLLEFGATVKVFHRGQELLEQDLSVFHIIVLDWMLPDLLGDQILVRLRGDLHYTGGVLFVTSRDSESDVAFILGLGADDYVVKPPPRRILLSRIEAIHRRANRQTPEATRIDLSPYKVDLVQRSISIHDDLVVLTAKEFDLAVYFLRRVGQLVGREQLLSDVWGKRGAIETRTVDVHVSSLRRRLRLRPENGFRLSTVHSLGYRLEHVQAAQSGSD